MKMITPSPATWDFTLLFRQVADAPWDAMKQCQHYFSPQGFGHDRHVYALCGAVVGIARAAVDDQVLRVRLHNDRVFEGAKKTLADEDILQHAFQCAMYAPFGSELYNTAWVRAAALKAIFETDLPTEAIPDEIRRQGGIYKMRDAAREGSQVQASGLFNPATARLIPAVNRLDAAVVRQIGPSKPPRKVRRALRFDPRRNLMIKASGTHIDECLSLESGDERTLTVRCNGESVSGIVDLEIISIHVATEYEPESHRSYHQPTRRPTRPSKDAQRQERIARGPTRPALKSIARTSG